MRVVGLIGPIAVGKSVVLEALEDCGAATVRADEVSRELLAPGTERLDAVTETFGTQFLTPDGSLRRRKLGDLIFTDAGARAKLERLMHPAMVARMRERIEELAQVGAPLVVVEAANLVEMGGLDLVDCVVKVTAPREDRVRRLMARDGLGREEAEHRVRVHEEMGIGEAAADYVLDAGGKEGDTRRKGERLWRELVQEGV